MERPRRITRPQRCTGAWLTGGALAVYGGLAWVACLGGGLLLGLAIDGDPDDETSQGASHGIGPAVPEILVVTALLLVVAYGIFFALLRRHGSSPGGR